MAFSTQVIVVLIRTLIPRATNWQHVTFIATNAYVYDYTYHIIFTVHICTRNYEKTFQKLSKTFQKLSKNFPKTLVFLVRNVNDNRKKLSKNFRKTFVFLVRNVND
ncbi:unknown protein [Bathycoccus prasinos]|uniref:Uncharacterized protein n=1 Tax=Bathycoccus prasinos TaxID=41875 RepID=K8F803_9CHLO|nr:unknown protein [Bathycoccus prasinos]CCO17738.1 unknown protein [Bathycoccus prasinos]|eukprot:XP_007511617.1 unknown protein [Bathycoccus prasinos]